MNPADKRTELATTSVNGFGDVRFRTPEVSDGGEMWRLALESGGLEVNSAYSYLMVCRHFADTSIMAEHGGEAVGFISGHRPQNAQDVVFVWQIAVSPKYRGRGVAVEMLSRLLEQPGCRHVRYLEATVTPSNEASRRTFIGLANRLGVPYDEQPCFTRDMFPDRAGDHEAEDIFRIGPIP